MEHHLINIHRPQSTNKRLNSVPGFDVRLQMSQSLLLLLLYDKRSLPHVLVCDPFDHSLAIPSVVVDHIVDRCLVRLKASQNDLSMSVRSL